MGHWDKLKNPTRQKTQGVAAAQSKEGGSQTLTHEM